MHVAQRTAGAGRHPAFPAPSRTRGRNDDAKLGLIQPRERGAMARGAGGRRVADQRRSPDRGSMSGSPGPASSRGLHGQPGFRDLSKLFALPVAAPVVGHRVATNEARSAREPLVNQRRVKASPNDRHERPGTPRARRGGAACASGAAASSPSCRPCHPEPPPPDEGRVCAGGPSDGLVHPRSASIGPSDWRARARTGRSVEKAQQPRQMFFSFAVVRASSAANGSL